VDFQRYSRVPYGIVSEQVRGCLRRICLRIIHETWKYEGEMQLRTKRGIYKAINRTELRLPNLCTAASPELECKPAHHLNSLISEPVDESTRQKILWYGIEW
jgi:hypothetical protein